MIKLICLNTWAGMIGTDVLLDFFKKYQDTDIFCLQEIYHATGYTLPKMAAGRNIEKVEPDLLEKIAQTLPNHAYFFTPQYVPYMGIATFYRKDLNLIQKDELCIYREPGYVSPSEIADHARTLQCLTFKTPKGSLTVLNAHAAWQPVGKIDTPERLEQSQRIINFSKDLKHPLILCGDFNLLPDTESIQTLERAGWKNLIRTNNIQSTRTVLYDKHERFADYIFLKNHLQIHNFQILPDVISDHAPLFLECSLA